MGLIQKLKSALGLDGARSPESGTDAPRDVDVTVEREPASESEDAVKGTDTAASGVGHSDEPEPETPGVDESNGDEVPIEEAEPGAADSTLDEFGEADDDALETADASAAATETDEETVETDAEPTAAASEDVDGSTGDAKEPSEAPVEPTETVEESDEADEETVETDEESVETNADEAPDVPDDPVTEISGIGPAYGQRLSDAGVDTVADLAAADADALEEATEISASRIEGWIDAAAEY